MFIKATEKVKTTTTYNTWRDWKLLQEDLLNKIEVSNLKYYSRITFKLTHAKKNTKTCWALLKFFSNNKKILLIPVLFYGNDYVTYFKKKAELFISFFAKQYSLISNSSELPLNLHYTTKTHLDTLNFSSNDIGKITQNLDPNKARHHDENLQ